MIRVLFPLLLVSTCLLSGCLTVPESVQYRGKPIPAVSVTSSCKSPFPITQDCSGFSGPTRLVRVDGIRGRVSASEDGSIIFVMAEGVWTVNTPQVTSLAQAIEDYLRERGFELIEIRAMATKQEIGGFFMVFSGDAYSDIKQLTVEN